MNYTIVNKNYTVITLELKSGSKTLKANSLINDIPDSEITQEVIDQYTRGIILLQQVEEIKPVKTKSSIKSDKEENS